MLYSLDTYNFYLKKKNQTWVLGNGKITLENYCKLNKVWGLCHMVAGRWGVLRKSYLLL